MFTYLKINTVVLICFAFVFRVLFMNISMFASSGTSLTKSHTAKHSSGTHKRRRLAESAVQPDIKDYAVMEVCEEGSGDEDDLVKTHSPAVLPVLHSFLKRIISIPKLSRPFDLIKCDLYPKKYLALSILRI